MVKPAKGNTKILAKSIINNTKRDVTVVHVVSLMHRVKKKKSNKKKEGMKFVI